jgi:2-oxoglutarate dehydrogenase E2 component (dihydrolipoamide succinyltransferase)
MSSLMEMRKKYKDQIQKEHDVKLGFMSAFARACTLALQEIPAANASIEGDEIVYRDYVDLSVAVATSKGLVTPVVRNAEGMGFIGIEKEISALGKKVGLLFCYRFSRINMTCPFFFAFFRPVMAS